MIKLDLKRKILYVEKGERVYEVPVPRDEIEDAALESFIDRKFPKLLQKSKESAKQYEAAKQVLENYIKDYSDIDALIEEYLDDIAINLWERYEDDVEYEEDLPYWKKY